MISVTLAALLLLAPAVWASHCAGLEATGCAWQGESWSPADSTTIGGTHTGLGTFTITAGTTVFVSDNLSITATAIVVAGVLASDGRGGKGWPGGGGGGAPAPQASGQAGGRGGGSDGSAASGGTGPNACARIGWAGGSAGTDLGSHGSVSGAGGALGAANGGAGGAGALGGYDAAGVNTDATTDDSLLAGSGGGGGGGGGAGNGGNNCIDDEWGGPGGGGGGGGSGGGRIALYSRGSFLLSGTLSSVGNVGQAGSTPVCANGGVTGGMVGAAGGPADGPGSALLTVDIDSGDGSPGVCGGAGGAGGHGAGGGVLLKHDGPGPLQLTGLVNARGGGATTANGGTVKVFTLPGRLPTGVVLNSTRVFGGRYFTAETLRRGSLLITQER